MNLSVIILTLNEEQHIARCLTALMPLEARQIYVIDCFSSDKTVEIAVAHQADVVQHAWPGAQSAQFNWALENLPIKTDWVLRLDADEYLTSGLLEEIKAKVLTLSADVTGVYLPLERTFLGKQVSRGVGKITVMRLFRYGHAKYSDRIMDERLVLTDGRAVTFDHAFVDDNLNGFDWWQRKHLGYAEREAHAMLTEQYGLAEACGKKAFYSFLPPFLRCFMYWGYRYFFRLGFLDGRAGWEWHFWQGLWYRLLVDRKIFGIKKVCGFNRRKIVDYVRGK